MSKRDSSGNIRFSSSDFNFTSPIASPTGRTIVHSRSGSGGSGGGSSLPQSTPETPTPLASELFGSSSQKEEQIRIFQTQGRRAFETSVAKTKARQQQVLREQQVTRELQSVRREEVIPQQKVQPTQQERVHVVQAAQVPGSSLDKLQRNIGIKRERITQRKKGFGAGATSFGLGLASSGIGTIQFGRSLLLHPIKTTKETGKGAIGIIKDPKATGKALGIQLKRDPSFTLGFAAGEVATLKGIPKAPGKTSDIFRTTKLKEVSPSKVIAPEFFKGQEYPAIKKGQTAGQLKAEFKPTLPGETQAAGFTASPKSIKGEIGRGSSELPGLYQAPRVSPHFLQVSKERTKLFSLNPFDTLTPTISRITPTKFKLAPGVKKGQKSISGRKKQTKEFFEKAPKGESIVPFIKAEKESVIPFGTTLQPKPTRFFVRFEGRKVPIQEFKTTPGTTKTLPKPPKVITARDIVRRSGGSSRRGRRGSVSPLEVSSVGRLSSSKTLKASSIISIPKSSGIGGSSRGRIGRGSSIFGGGSSGFVGGGSSGFGGGGSSSFISKGSSSFISKGSSITGGGGSSRGRGTGRIITTPKIIKNPFSPQGRRKPRGFVKRRKGKAPPRTPSLFAIGRNIKAPRVARGESSGLTIRPIITSKKKKKKGGKKR